MQTCEQCGQHEETESYVLYDYCAECLKNLCEACMKKGCCGHIPALSGDKEDYDED